MAALTQHFWLLLPLTVVLSAGLGWLLIPFATKIGWVDHPGERKVHESKTPIIGGMAVFVALVTAFCVARISGAVPDFATDRFFLFLLGGGAVLFLMGLLDDLVELNALLRLLLQLAVCLAVVHFTGVQLHDFGQLFSNTVFVLYWLAMPLTIFAALGVINSFNLIDGMDGLSGAMFLITASGLAVFAALAGKSAMAWFLLIAMAAVLGFLLLNARFPWNDKARVFMGDSGSLMLGLLLAWCLIRLGSGPERAFMPMTAVWLFAVPLLDTTTLIWRRWGEGRSAFSADQNHLHHAFLRAGYSVGEAWAMMIMLSLVLAGIGVGFEFGALPDYVSFYSFMLLALTYYFYMKHCWAAQRFLGRHFIHHDFTVEDPISFSKT
jgi:UDP-GlcNAc:undecaprenyl-phosphate/decaprenyl-phosphate GlcNAc-1-phosphate transferase